MQPGWPPAAPCIITSRSSPLASVWTTSDWLPLRRFQNDRDLPSGSQATGPKELSIERWLTRLGSEASLPEAESKAAT